MSISTYQRKIAIARESFFEYGTAPFKLRAETERSWRRSRLAGVSPDATPNLRFEGDVERDGYLLRATRQVCQTLMQQLGDTEAALMAIDNDARIIGRWDSKGRLEKQLNAWSAHPGFIFEEASAGNSGLGTVLEDRTVTVVDGAEHYNSTFDSVVAVGAPIIHPTTGRMEGAMDIVCRVGTPAPLMKLLITRAASDVGELLVSGNARADRELLDAFLQTDRRGPKRGVVALNHRLTMTNRRADELLKNQPSDELWGSVLQAVEQGRQVVRLQTDRSKARNVSDVGRITMLDEERGAIVQFTAEHRDASAPPTLVSARDRRIASQIAALAPGRSNAWQTVIQSVAKVGAAGRLLILGPAGSGKSTLAMAYLAAHNLGSAVEHSDWSQIAGDTGAEELSTLDSAQASAILLQHIEQMDSSALNSLSGYLSELTESHPVVATFRTDELHSSPPAILMSDFEHVVEVPSLAARSEDVSDIVDAILVSEPSGVSQVEATAMRQLETRDWPGNIRQLKRVVQAACLRAEGSAVQVSDLPSELCTKLGRRRLSRLEVVERDAIAGALAAANGNRSAAAAALGISRSGLYRKLESLQLN